jgi:hypothetical protein
VSERVLVPEWSGFTLLVPIPTSRGSNAREHHQARATRVRKERAAVRFCWVAARKPKIHLPALVELTRVSPHHAGLDDDNVRGALKAIRDEVAAIAGCEDDARAPIAWTYQQERGAWGVKVRVRPGRCCPAPELQRDEHGVRRCDACGREAP